MLPSPRLALAAAALVTAGLALPAVAAPPDGRGGGSGRPAPQAGADADGPDAPPPAQLQDVDGSTTRSYSVPTRHGTLYLEVVHPTRGGEVLPAQGILTLSPYSVLGRNGDAADWVPRGYARMYADVVGTGNSGGCYDYGGTRERETGADLVEWIVAQGWSLGRVGMTGGSYDGTTATATAVERPQGLATIVPEVAISRWYDYAYSGGMRYTYTNEMLGKRGAGAAAEEGFDTPLAFDFGLAVPPPLDVQSPDWADRVRDNLRVCDEVAHTERGYDTTPDYDAFWAERDYTLDAPKVKIPVLVAHNWGDWNVKQDTGLRLFESLTGSKERRLFFGSRWQGHGRAGGTYADVKKAWMDRWVGGVKNGIEDSLPEYTSRTSDAAGPGDYVFGPAPTPEVVTLTSSADGTLVDGDGVAGSSAPQPFVEGTETTSIARAGAGYVLLQTAPLARDVRMVGRPTIDLGLDTGRTWTTLTPSVLDLDGSGAPASRVGITRGWLDTRYAGGLQERTVGDGSGLDVALEGKPTDYVFRAGNRIGLLVQTSTNEWTMPKAYDGPPCATCATWSLRLGPDTSLSLPLVGVDGPLFVAE